jgi:D-alanyl-D-alanine carboxypeptidase
MSHRPTPGAGAPAVPVAPVFPLRLHVALLVVAAMVLLTGFGVVLTHDDRAAAAGVERDAGAPAVPEPVQIAGAQAEAPEEPEPEVAAAVEVPPAAPEPAPAARPDLPARIEAVLADPALADRLVGVTVTDADGRVVFERGGDLPLLPASTQKLVVAAGALVALGADFRYETRLHATAVPTDGVLHGSLVLEGRATPPWPRPPTGR